MLALRWVSYLPLALLRLLGGVIGYCGWHARGRARRITEINLRYCLPQLDPSARRRLARRSLVNTAISALEVAALWHRPKSWVVAKITRTEGLALFQRYLAEARGLIILAPHMGNWEVLNVQLSAHCEILSLYKPHALPELDKLMLDARTRIGGVFAPAERNSIKRLLVHLQQGKTACILPDQVPADNSSAIGAPFFGHTAKTMTLVYRLIQKTRCRVIFVYCQRVPGGFATVFREPDPAIYASDKMVSVAALNRGVEQCVLAVPEQYQWEYKRFKEAQPFYKK